jgi:hypothetical protein
MIEKLIHNECFFSEEAWFSLYGEVNSQNSRYWSAENQRFIHELPLFMTKELVFHVQKVHAG